MASSPSHSIPVNPILLPTTQRKSTERGVSTETTWISTTKAATQPSKMGMSWRWNMETPTTLRWSLWKLTFLDSLSTITHTWTPWANQVSTVTSSGVISAPLVAPLWITHSNWRLLELQGPAGAPRRVWPTAKVTGDPALMSMTEGQSRHTCIRQALSRPCGRGPSQAQGFRNPWCHLEQVHLKLILKDTRTTPTPTLACPSPQCAFQR